MQGHSMLHAVALLEACWACRYEREFNATLAAAAVAKDVPAAKAAVGPVKLLYDTRQQYENLAGEC